MEWMMKMRKEVYAISKTFTNLYLIFSTEDGRNLFATKCKMEITAMGAAWHFFNLVEWIKQNETQT